MGNCLNGLNEKQRSEITELVAAPVTTIIALLMRKYDICSVCALHVVMTTVLAVFKMDPKIKAVDPEYIVEAMLSSIAKVYDLELVEFDDADKTSSLVLKAKGGQFH